MSGDVHVRFCERLEGRFLRATRLVVACRSRAEAEAAARRVRASLEEIDLRLNQDKTRITRFDDGFRFLGYTFLGDLAVDTLRRRNSQVSGALDPEDLPPRLLARAARPRRPDRTGGCARTRRGGRTGVGGSKPAPPARAGWLRRGPAPCWSPPRAACSALPTAACAWRWRTDRFTSNPGPRLRPCSPSAARRSPPPP